MPTINCGWLTPAEQVATSDVVGSLNGAIQTATLSTGTRVGFADVTNALRGHELCTPDSWVNPVQSLTQIFGTEQAHPNYRGQTAYEQMVAKDLNIF
jgi:hypothetical protein